MKKQMTSYGLSGVNYASTGSGVCFVLTVLRCPLPQIANTTDVTPPTTLLFNDIYIYQCLQCKCLVTCERRDPRVQCWRSAKQCAQIRTQINVDSCCIYFFLEKHSKILCSLFTLLAYFLTLRFKRHLNVALNFRTVLNSFWRVT